MKSQIVTVAVSLISVLGLPILTLAECGQENKSVSIKNFETQAVLACDQNLKYGILIVRPFVPAIGNYAKTVITCSRVIGEGNNITLSSNKNPKLTNSIQVLGDVIPDTIQEGEIPLQNGGKITYRINLKKD
jgi:hypothetical protein